MNKLLLISLMSVAISGFAQDGIRCGNDLFETGEANINQVQQSCTNNNNESVSEYHVQNNDADITHVYIKQGGMTNDLTFIDGKLNTIDSNRQ